MNNQTLLNEQKNRGAYNKNALESAIRSIWQGHVESNHDLRFWRPLY